MRKDMYRGLCQRTPLLGAALVAGMAILAMVGLIIFADARGLPPDVLLYNPAYQFRFWPYAGLPLHLGVFAMGGAGAICCFAAFSAGKARNLLLAAGLFSFSLAADDFFMLHQQFWPKRGVPPAAVYAVYALLTTAGLVHFRCHLRTPGTSILWAAILVLAGSLAVDLAGPVSTLTLVIEDTLKFAGFCLWSVFWILKAHQAVSIGAQPGCCDSADQGH